MRWPILAVVLTHVGLLSAKAEAALTAFGVTPAMQTNDSVVVYILNGKTAQDMKITLLDPQGAVLTSVSKTLTPDDGNGGALTPSSLTLSWINSGGPLSNVVIQVDAGLYFYNANDGTVLMAVTGFDANQSLGFAADRGSFLTPISHDHDPNDPGHGGGHDPPTSTNPFLIGTFQNYPNPFKSGDGTHFIYSVSYSSDTSHGAHGTTPPVVSSVGIRIWSPSGHLVKTITAATNALRGVIQWDGKDDSGKALGTGVYLAEILVNSDQSFSARLKLAIIGGH